MLEHVRELPGLSTPPGGDRRQLQLLAEQVAAQTRQERQDGGRLDHPRAERVGNGYVAGPCRLDQAGDAERRIAAQLERVAEAVVEPAEDDVDRLQAFQRLDEDPAITHRQVAAFDQGEAQIAREVRMLEVRFVVRPGRQQHDPGLVSRLRRHRPERVALSAEERRQPVNLTIAERFGQAAQQDDPVFERIPGAGRRLRPVGEHPPLTVGRAHQVGGMQVEVNPVRHANASTRS